VVAENDKRQLNNNENEQFGKVVDGIAELTKDITSLIVNGEYEKKLQGERNPKKGLRLFQQLNTNLRLTKEALSNGEGQTKSIEEQQQEEPVKSMSPLHLNGQGQGQQQSWHSK